MADLVRGEAGGRQEHDKGNDFGLRQGDIGGGRNLDENRHSWEGGHRGSGGNCAAAWHWGRNKAEDCGVGGEETVEWVALRPTSGLMRRQTATVNG